MPELLGSLLLRQGHITKAQLDAGLAAQAKHKGRLGTNLVELKLLTLNQLAKALAEQRGGTLAAKEELDAATANVLVSKRVAKQHLVVPIRVDNRILVVAMASAWDQAAVDALERELRSRVQAKLAPELVVLRYLDRMYDVSAGRPVSVYDHPFGDQAPVLGGSGFLTEEGDEAFLCAPAPPTRPLGPPARPSRPGEAAPPPKPAAKVSQPHIESNFDALVRGGVPKLQKAPKPEEKLEEVEPLPDDLPMLSGTVLEDAGAPDDKPGEPAAPLPDIPDEWK